MKFAEHATHSGNSVEFDRLDEQMCEFLERDVDAVRRCNLEVVSYGGDWPEFPLDDLCLGVYDCPHSTPKLSDVGPFMVRTQDIRQGFFDTSSAVHVSEAVYQERIKRVEPAHGDLLFSREGTYFGDAAAVNTGSDLAMHLI